MKKLGLFIGALALLGTMFTSCDPKDPTTEDVILDGLYVYGNATALDKVATKGMFAKGINENGGELQAGLWEKYVALEAGKDFVIAEVKGGTTTIYGADGELINDSTTGADWSITGAVVHKGAYKLDGTKFQVEESGVYQVVVFTTNQTVYLIPTKWRMNSIYAPATPENTHELVVPTFNKEKMTFKLEGVEATASNFKFQSYEGWKYVIDEALAIRVNCNFGAAKDTEGTAKFAFDGTVNQLLAGGPDIPLARKNKAVYTVELIWNLEKGLGFTAKMTKTGSVNLADPAEFNLGLIGSAVGSWDVDVPFTYVATTSWDYEITNQLILADAFKVRTVGTWEDVVLGYNDLTITGDADNFKEAATDGNIACKVETTYAKITLSYNGDTDKWTLNFQK